jgi:hypothetical protein
MKTKLLYTNLLILIFIGLNHCVSGQPLLKDNLQTLINGKTWVPQTSVALGEQFFLEKMNLKGSFLFKGIQFDNIQFSYDISTETIITAIETQDKTKRNIIVNPLFLEGFSVIDASHNFNFLRGDLIHPKLEQYSYYQIVKFQNIQYVIRRQKHKILKSDSSKKFKYVIANSLFIIKDNELIPIHNKIDILKIYTQEKKEIKRFIRNNKLKISSKKPMDVVVLLSKFNL